MGGNPRVFITFISFVLCYFKLFFRYLCNEDTKKIKKLSLLTRRVGTTRACGGTTVPLLNTKKRGNGREGGTTRAFRGKAVPA